ncbi:uroporphyrinogen-III synthase [Fictibacillus fluitans]|uniref:Uroporphyrinogen-III synthase n=1 Tax=Fictibacillus fluitans TaxID=3058422 RepID=A0ABT8I1W7_9BACL|nr:uroporphyrinogen-III synthase [Fictibacillus sp. NE201]MDN4527025.1 uroporphyrinogen-III synthase [Fictibacillus sp. NE201]
MNACLTGKTVVVTRAAAQSRKLLSRLREEGADAVSFPVMHIEKAPLDLSSAQRLSREFETFEWVVFTSINGVRYFLEWLHEQNLSIGDKKVAAVGQKTAESLNQQGISVDLMPEQFEGSELAALLKRTVTPGVRVLVPKGNLAKSTIKKTLAGIADVVEIIVYETKRNPVLDFRQLPDKVDMLLFMSPSSISFFSEMAGGRLADYRDIPTACVGPVTASKAKATGFRKLITANDYTEEGIMDSVRIFFGKGKQ